MPNYDLYKVVGCFKEVLGKPPCTPNYPFKRVIFPLCGQQFSSNKYYVLDCSLFVTFVLQSLHIQDGHLFAG